jgi:hypothetical protein
MKNNPLQVLLIEDSAGDARLLREMFSKERAGSFELTHLVRLGEAEIHLAKTRADIILLIVAATDQIGAAALAQTVREQLDLSDQIQHAGLTHSTSYRLLKADAIQQTRVNR